MNINESKTANNEAQRGAEFCQSSSSLTMELV